MAVKNLIIDGTNIEYRVFFIARKNIQLNSNGERIELINKFLDTFHRLVKEFDPDNIYCCWDKKLDWPCTNFRDTTLEGEYKSGRSKVEDIQEMFRQEEILIQILSAFGVRNMFPNRLEADDVVSWLTQQLNDCIVISVDQDLLQLVRPGVSVYNLTQLITINNFEEKYEITPEQYLLYKCIKGDPSDNIQGLPGFGVKRSRRLAKDWDNNTLSDEYQEIIERNKQLIDLSNSFQREPNEEVVYKEQFNLLTNNHEQMKNFDRFTELLEDHEINHFNKLDQWKNIFKRNSLADLINSLPDPV